MWPCRVSENHGWYDNHKTVGYDILVESILIHLFGLFIKPYIKSIVCLFKTVYIKVVNQHIGKDGA